MLDVTSGSIVVHGMNMMHAPGSVVREKFFVTIPQDATLFSQASLRFNLDSTETLGKDRICSALEKVNLLRHFQISSNDESGAAGSQQEQEGSMSKALDSPLYSLCRLSTGQAQLLALARALLQVHNITESGYKPVILLDEATSSMDTDTEKVMLSVVQEEFIAKGYTVLMVAHRLGAAKAIMREGIDKMVEM